MNLKTRRLLYLFTIILFIVAAPIILLLSRGKHFNLTTFRFTETGGLYIKWYPKNSSLTMNQEFVSKKSPARIRYISPGRYDIQLEKNGHYDFTTTVEVKSGKAVLLDPIELFARIPEFKPAMQNVTNIFSSPYDARLLIEQENSQGEFLLLINDGGISRKLSNQTEKIEDVSWSSNGNIIFRTKKSFSFYDVTEETVYGPFSGIRFSGFSKNEAGTFYGSFDNKILNVDYKTTTVETTLLQGIDLVETDKHRVLVKNNGSGSTIFIANNIENFEKVGTISNYLKIFPLTSEYLIVYTANDSFLLDAQAKKMIPLGAALATFNVSGSTLFYATDFEVWKFNLETQERTLISRLSEKVKTLDVSPKKSALFLTTPTSIIFHYLGTQNVSQKTIPLPKDASTAFYHTTNNSQYSIGILTQESLSLDLFSL